MRPPEYTKDWYYRSLFEMKYAICGNLGVAKESKANPVAMTENEAAQVLGC
jgi:hypothetical protein